MTENNINVDNGLALQVTEQSRVAKWQKWHDKCQVCARNDVLYCAKGMCMKCYKNNQTYSLGRKCKKCDEKICNTNKHNYCVSCRPRRKTKLPVVHIKQLRHTYGWTLQAIANKLTTKYGRVTRERIRQLAGNISNREAFPYKCRCGKLFTSTFYNLICDGCKAKHIICKKCGGTKHKNSQSCIKCYIPIKKLSQNLINTIKKFRRKGLAYHNISKITGVSTMACYRYARDGQRVYRGKFV
jgi:hypothetical protein